MDSLHHESHYSTVGTILGRILGRERNWKKELVLSAFFKGEAKGQLLLPQPLHPYSMDIIRGNELGDKLAEHGRRRP